MLAIIGGSGLYQLEGLVVNHQHTITTPFGEPSAPIIEGLYRDQPVLFLARHGEGHKFLPHEVNYRANIFALKSLGARRVLGFSAAGSLRQDIGPGDLALPSQYFDHTRGKRTYSFFGNGVAAHISSAYPTCPALGADIADAAARIGQHLHVGKTYACVEGPRLGTRTESFFLRDSARCDLVGMTNVPEVFLAREAQVAYCSLCLITDYDCWMDDPAEHVSVDKFFATYQSTLAKAQKVLTALLEGPLRATPDEVRTSLASAVLTATDALSPEQKAWLHVLQQ